MTRARIAVAGIVSANVWLMIAGCSDRGETVSEPPRDPKRHHRVIEPPAGVVRPLPPHAIRGDGVGPYRLGERVAEMLDELPSGPRLTLLDVPGLVHRGLIRAEDGAVLIGGEPTGTATFVAVVGREVARTESGIHVGSTRSELVAALGPPVSDFARAKDPRLVIPAALPNARVVMSGTGDTSTVSAIVMTSDAWTPAREPAAEGTCLRPASTATSVGACLISGELVEVTGNDIVVRAKDSEKVLATLRIPNAVYAVPIRHPGDSRDELVAITYNDDHDTRAWSIVGYRFDQGRPVRTVDPFVLYRLSSANVRWIGAELREVDLYLELMSRGDAIEVGGLLTARPNTGAPRVSWRDVVTISTVMVTRKHGKSAAPDGDEPPPADARPPDADRAPGSGSKQ
ncbi:MAG: hypothetical protein AB7O24_19430 [Kofleriaceae bacterium]